MQTLFFTLLAFGILVTIHELGHYTVARWCGVKVLRFSLGVGKVVFSRKFGADQTEWVISALPLGGYVKMLDARDLLGESVAQPISAEDLPREFSGQPVWKRIAIVAAGPLANFLLAIALFFALFVHGVPEAIPKIRVPSTSSAAYVAGLRQGDVVLQVNQHSISTWSELRSLLVHAALDKQTARILVSRHKEGNSPNSFEVVIDLSFSQVKDEELDGDFLGKIGISFASPPAVLKDVDKDGPAARANFQKDDLVLAINSVPVLDTQDFSEIVSRSPGQTLLVKIERDQRQIELKVIPDTQDINGVKTGRIKVALMPPETQLVRTALVPSVVKATTKTFEISALTLKMMGQMLIGQTSLKNISGPLTIAEYAGHTSRAGAMSYIGFIALISISLGVMNLLPIPVLDGGHLLYYSLELFTGKPVSERFSEVAQRIGIAMLVVLMAIAFYNDIARKWHNAEPQANQVKSAH